MVMGDSDDIGGGGGVSGDDFDGGDDTVMWWCEGDVMRRVVSKRHCFL